MATILEFYFRFPFWRIYSHRHVILHLPAKFRSKRTIGGGLWGHIDFSRWRP